MPKIDGFYKLYEKKLEEYRAKELKLLEIGVQDGSSIAYWRQYSPKWDVWGLDTDTSCRGHQIVIGSQEDKETLKQFNEFDIIIDDGGHTWKQQIETFETLFPTLNSGGLYVIEDLHTSMWDRFNDYHVDTLKYLGGILPHISHSMINVEAKKHIKDLGIDHMEFYPSIVLIYKR